VLSKQEQDTFYKKVGLLVKAQRQKANLSQEDLSKKLGFVSRISIANIESGKQKIQLHTLVEISDFLNLPVTELIPPVDAVRKDVNPKLLKKIGKEVNREVIRDPQSAEKLTAFVRFSTSKK
jgi:transcriptional regulator with XRE-family HTH domain